VATDRVSHAQCWTFFGHKKDGDTQRPASAAGCVRASVATATRKKRDVRDVFADAFAFRKVLGRLWPHVDSPTRSKSADSLQVHSWFAVGFYQQLALGAMSSAQWNGRMICAAHH